MTKAGGAAAVARCGAAGRRMCGDFETAAGGSKRAKASATETAPGFDFDNLPDPLLRHIAGYLRDKISRALLAVALTAPSSSWRKAGWKVKPSPTALTILSPPRQTFWRIEEYAGCMNFSLYSGEKLAGLSDEDIGGVLTCFMALPLRTREGEPCNTVREVELTHCYSLRGNGLEPLRGSAHLEKINLSLVRWGEESVTEVSLDETVVLPILESIIDAEGCSLGHIQFPKKWRTEQSDSLRRFLEKCNEAVHRHKFTCSARRWVVMSPSQARSQGGGWHSGKGEFGAYPKCGNLCRGTAEQPWFSLDRDDFATHNFSCSQCRDIFCSECVDDFFPNEMCERCDKKYCFGCSGVLTCRQCQETTCQDCTGIDVCNGCEKVTCSECDPIMYCGGCEESNCRDCVPLVRCEYPQCEMSDCENCAGGVEMVRRCLDCNVAYCPEHMLQMHVEHGVSNYCADCNDMASYSLSEHSEHFYKWVKMLESKYGDQEYAILDVSSSGLEGLEVEEQLHQRCRSIGAKMSLEQKQSERFDAMARWVLDLGMED